MEVEILWTDFAKSKLNLIFKYYDKKSGRQSAIKLVDGIISSTNKLANQPESGQLEPYEVDLFHQFRSVKFKKYKIIYLFRRKQILVLTVFDMKQNPQKIKKELTKIKNKIGK